MLRNENGTCFVTKHAQHQKHTPHLFASFHLSVKPVELLGYKCILEVLVLTVDGSEFIQGSDISLKTI